MDGAGLRHGSAQQQEHPQYNYHKLSVNSPIYADSQDSTQLSRRSSVFSDLITVFRKNTLLSAGRRSLYHPPPRASYDQEAATIPELHPGTSASVTVRNHTGEDTGDKDDEDEDDDEDTGKKPTRQVLLNKIRKKKEVINKLRCQPWSMNRKRRTLKLAQKYLEQQESKISKMQLFKEDMTKRWGLFLRSLRNFNTYLIPWESKIKKIESHFGSVVSSYFTFLRWVIFMNVILTLIVSSFVSIPEVIADVTADAGRWNRTRANKEIPVEEREHATELQVVWHFDGYLRYSPLFYGYYSKEKFLSEAVRYSVPLAYFIITLVVFGYSFFAILRKMASNAAMSKMAGSKAEQYIFNWKVFTEWDYSIGNAETASNTTMAIIIKLREAIAESRIQTREQFRCLQFSLRVLANLLILSMLAFSIYCISFAVQSSETVEKTGSLFTKNQVPSVVSTITHVFPMIFDLIGRMENYHPRTALRAHLGRVLVLYVLNYMTLIIALFDKLDNIRDSTRTLDEDDASGLARRRRHALANTTQPFLSRNFSSVTQLSEFLSRPVRMTPRTTTPKSSGRITVDGAPVKVQSQYGPVGVNNPTILMRNVTALPPTQYRYETRRLGPTKLPIFSPAPTSPRPRIPTYRAQEYGPDWTAATRRRQDEDDENASASTTDKTLIWTKEDGQTNIGPVGPVSAGEEVTLKPNNGGKNGQDAQSGVVFIDENGVPQYLNDTNNGTEMVVGDKARVTTDEDVHYEDAICWETMIGQEIVRLVTMDLIITIVMIIIIDFLRGLWVKYCSSWWCWDIETTFPEYGEFKVAENVLHIINNQGMIWLGLFFAPLLPLINNVKLIIVMYIRAWAVMSCNVPAREIFRASRSSNFYLIILLLWLMLCTLPVCYVIASKRPSSSCGPFAGQNNFYNVITNVIEDNIDKKVLFYIKKIMSPGIIVPLVIFLLLIIYFLFSLVRGLRETNADLQQQLVHERTEEKRKIFELAGGGNKKKPSDLGRPSKPQAKKPSQYLPDIENKRREPWRIYTGADHASSLCPSDEPPSTLNSPYSDLSPDQTPRTRPDKILLPNGSPTRRNFRPSLGSLEEAENSDNPSARGEENMKISMSYEPVISMSKSTSLARSGPKDSGEEWAEEENQSDRSGNYRTTATPDELRDLMAPLERISPSGISLAAFPKSSSPVTVIFGTSGSGSVSRRSSKRNSFVSLYENPDDHSGTCTHSHSQWRPTPRPSGFPQVLRSSYTGYASPFGHERQMPSTTIVPYIKAGSVQSGRDASPAIVSTTSSFSASFPAGATPAPEAPQNIALYSKEPRRIGHKESLKRQDSKDKSKKFEGSGFADEFVPWPSIDEVKAQRAHLLPKSMRPPRGPSPPKMVRSEHSDLPSTSSTVQPARFRISVSPTRKLHKTDSAGSDSEGGSGKRRYIIKQQKVIPGSSVSIASSMANRSTAPTPSSLKTAPRVEFGDDDSPRVQEAPDAK